MKKELAVILLAAVLAFTTGCSGKAPAEDGSSDTPPSSDISESKPESGDKDDSSNNKGEPTFLICPDGTPVYTSEITSIFTGSDSAGNRCDISLEEAEKLAREGGDFTVVCTGFVYAYIPENAFNRVDDPGLFSARDDVIILDGAGDFDCFGYTGAEIPPSTKYIRLDSGGKFGGLTVKNAVTYFGRSSVNENARDLSDQPGGIFLRGGSVEFDGELELSGYVSVSPYSEFYGTGGKISFYPDLQSCSKLPVTEGYWDGEAGGFVHSPYETVEGYYGDLILDLGDIFGITVDMGGLKPGDFMVKAEIVIKDIGFEFNPDYGMTFQHITLKDIRF